VIVAAHDSFTRVSLTIMLLGMAASAEALMIEPTFGNLPVEFETLARASIASWEGRILDPFVIHVDYALTALPGDALARAVDFVASAEGRPQKARIEIDTRDGDVGWFVDATPTESSEFVERRGRLIADPSGPAAGRFDLLTVLDHELAHTLGFSVAYPLFNAHVASDPDGRRHYLGSSLDVLLSSVGTHLATGDFSYDLMTALLGSAERRHVSTLDLLILADAFDYQVALQLPPPLPVPEPTTGALVCVTMAFAVVWSRARVARAVTWYSGCKR
jgi:hypothetical protein